MELSWSTFLLEIINFLVLIWILKRFLYKPVLNVIAQRRTDIENQSAEAQRLHKEAEALNNQYGSRLADWEQERQQAREVLTQELDCERARQMEVLQTDLAQERKKAQSADEHRRTEAVREIEHQALQQSAEFASRLLAMATGPELETRLINLVVKELETLNPHQALLMKEHWGEHPRTITICSVYPLAKKQTQQLEAALTKIVGQSIPVVYSEEPELLAGVHISIGAWVLQTNVRDELKGFAEFAHVTR